MIEQIGRLFSEEIKIEGNLIMLHDDYASEYEQKLTNEAFTEKWKEAEKDNVMTGEGLEFQKKWYLDLYGFASNEELSEFLSYKAVILDAGCGLGYKAAFFAELSPKSLVIGMDFSDSVYIAREKYKSIPNLFFIKGDIGNTRFQPNSIDYVSCDQVMHHTSNPPKTLNHFNMITKLGGEIATYVYAKKALPRELIDDYFRKETSNCSNEELWELSNQLTTLGKVLSDLKVSVDIPDIPLLGIKGGRQDLQRFLYWNFLKCFWNEDLGITYSVSTNFDWYSPTNAFRYSENEFKQMIDDNNLEIIHLHKEEACYSGRFKKTTALNIA
jgi:SAM-dependent methyltransferase